MRRTPADETIADYRRDLERALEALDSAETKELSSEVASHLEDAQADDRLDEYLAEIEPPEAFAAGLLAERGLLPGKAVVPEAARWRRGLAVVVDLAQRWREGGPGDAPGFFLDLGEPIRYDDEKDPMLSDATIVVTATPRSGPMLSVRATVRKDVVQQDANSFLTDFRLVAIEPEG